MDTTNKTTMGEESLETCLALIKKDLSYIKEKVDDIETKVEGSYVTKTEFSPVKDSVVEIEKKIEGIVLIKQIVYGIVGLVLLTVFGGLLTLVLKS